MSSARRSRLGATSLSRQADETLALIDEIAETIEVSEDRHEQYRIGREILLDYYKENPQSVFAISQGTKYLFARLEMHPQERM